ncbi:unnamed protein product [Calypogeia fissa]
MALYERRLSRDRHPPPSRRRFLKSGFGNQIVSYRVTSPAYGFGSSSREVVAEKMYVNADLAKLKPDNCSPGPVYDRHSAFGKQPKSRNENPPETIFPMGVRWFRRRREEEPPGPGAYNQKSSFLTQFAPSRQKSPVGVLFGTGTRKGQDKVYVNVDFEKVNYGTASPGPSVYPPKSTLGRQPLSHNRTAPLVGFINDQRFKYHLMGRVGETTGPGQYDLKGSIGRQDESHRSTRPNFSFGSASREKANKVFISVEHDKINYGVQSPGPAGIKLKGSLGKQTNSKHKNAAISYFGRDSRWHETDNELPGPGAYDC